MRVKSLVEPMGIIQKGDEWLSPEGHSPTWHRVWNGLGWDCKEGPGFPEPPAPVEPSELEEPQIDPESLEEIEIEIADDESDDQPEEDHDDEHGMQAAVSDSNGVEQGPSGKPEPEPKQRGKRGKVRKGGKGK